MMQTKHNNSNSKYTRTNVKPGTKTPNRARDATYAVPLPTLSVTLSIVHPSHSPSKKVPDNFGVVSSLVDVYEDVKGFTTLVPYNSFECMSANQRYTHSPYAIDRIVTFTMDNFAFERFNSVTSDLKTLFMWVEKKYLPAVNVRNCDGSRVTAAFVGMNNETDVAFIKLPAPSKNGNKPAPCKRRHILVRTNNELLLLEALKQLYVLPDRSGFRVCCNDEIIMEHVIGAPSQTASSITPEMFFDEIEAGDEQAPSFESPVPRGSSYSVTHNKAKLKAYCDSLRGLGVRARHRKTQQLPCTSLVFDRDTNKARK